MHVRASPGESFSRKQDENGPLVQKLGPGPAQQQALKTWSISGIRVLWWCAQNYLMYYSTIDQFFPDLHALLFYVSEQGLPTDLQGLL